MFPIFSYLFFLNCMNSNELNDQNNTKMPVSARNPPAKTWTSTIIVNKMKFPRKKDRFLNQNFIQLKFQVNNKEM